MADSWPPEAILIRFRTLGLERLARIEAGWNSGAVRAIGRELHTLRGDAHVLGLEDIALLSARLEELLLLPREPGSATADEIDLFAMLTIQMVEMLLRGVRGLDLQGFVRQLEAVLRTNS